MARGAASQRRIVTFLRMLERAICQLLEERRAVEVSSSTLDELRRLAEIFDDEKLDCAEITAADIAWGWLFASGCCLNVYSRCSAERAELACLSGSLASGQFAPHKGSAAGAQKAWSLILKQSEDPESGWLFRPYHFEWSWMCRLHPIATEIAVSQRRATATP